MLDIQNLSKSYQKGGVKAVDGLSLQARGGEILGLLGPNGAGKTTTLKMITGILTPDEGDVIIEGHSITHDSLEAKKCFGFVPDEPDAFLRLKGLEYLRFIADIYEVPKELRKDRIDKMAEDFGMTDALGDRLSSYSHGMRQKIVLMGALIHQPPVWILDEPMVGLDPKSAFILKNMMREHADQGNIVLFSTHVLDVAEKVCDRIAIIDRGRLIHCGTLEEMREHFKNDSSLEQMFLQMTSEYEDEAGKEGESSHDLR